MESKDYCSGLASTGVWVHSSYLQPLGLWDGKSFGHGFCGLCFALQLKG